MNLNSTNQQSLNALKRIITKFNGKFSLAFAHCNDDMLRAAILKQLEQELAKGEYCILKLGPATRSLHQTILNYTEERPPKALIVFGLETVADIDGLSALANQTRDLFADLPFPLILWLTDSVSRKFSRIAPDFNSWGTPIGFTTEETQKRAETY